MFSFDKRPKVSSVQAKPNAHSVAAKKSKQANTTTNTNTFAQATTPRLDLTNTPYSPPSASFPVQRLPEQSNVAFKPPLSLNTIHKEAAKGVSGAGQRLPHFERIQKAFGPHDLSHVRAYTGNAAQTAAKNIDAQAYATGDKIAFAENNPSLHTVAHEAAHIVQQQAGVHLKSNVGRVGDIYERQADSIADAIVQNRSTVHLLPSASISASVNSHSSMPVQRKVAWFSANKYIDNPLEIKQNNDPAKSHKKPTIKLEYTTILSTIGTFDEIINILKDHPSIYRFDKPNTLVKQYTLLKNFIDELQKKNMLDAAYTPQEEFKKDTPTYRQALNKIVQSNNPSLSDLQITPGRPLYTSPEFGYFNPRSVSTPEPDLKLFYTQINTDNKFLPHSYKAAKGKLHTQVEWKNAEGILGKGMKAEPLGPEHPLGSEPGSGNKSDWVKARKAMDTIADTGSYYIAGHLLNAQLGGPGDEVKNLTPIPKNTNSAHSSKVETQIKDWVNNRHLWAWYEMDVSIQKINGGINPSDNTNPKFDPIFQKDKKAVSQAYADLGGNYPAKLSAKWGLLDKYGIRKGGTEHSLDIAIADPVRIRKYRHKDAGLVKIDENTDASNFILSYIDDIDTLVNKPGSSNDIEQFFIDHLNKLSLRGLEELAEAKSKTTPAKTNQAHLVDLIKLLNQASKDVIVNTLGAKKLRRLFTFSEFQEVLGKGKKPEDLLLEAAFDPTTDLTKPSGFNVTSMGYKAKLSFETVPLIIDVQVKAFLAALSRVVPELEKLKANNEEYKATIQYVNEYMPIMTMKSLAAMEKIKNNILERLKDDAPDFSKIKVSEEKESLEKELLEDIKGSEVVEKIKNDLKIESLSSENPFEDEEKVKDYIKDFTKPMFNDYDQLLVNLPKVFDLIENEEGKKLIVEEMDELFDINLEDMEIDEIENIDIKEKIKDIDYVDKISDIMAVVEITLIDGFDSESTMQTSSFFESINYTIRTNLEIEIEVKLLENISANLQETIVQYVKQKRKIDEITEYAESNNETRKKIEAINEKIYAINLIVKDIENSIKLESLSKSNAEILKIFNETLGNIKIAHKPEFLFDLPSIFDETSLKELQENIKKVLDTLTTEAKELGESIENDIKKIKRKTS